MGCESVKKKHWPRITEKLYTVRYGSEYQCWWCFSLCLVGLYNTTVTHLWATCLKPLLLQYLYWHHLIHFTINQASSRLENNKTMESVKRAYQKDVRRNFWKPSSLLILIEVKQSMSNTFISRLQTPSRSNTIPPWLIMNAKTGCSQTILRCKVLYRIQP